MSEGRQNAIVFLAMLAASLLFYGMALDNDFWHPEDFRLLGEAQTVLHDPSMLLSTDASENYHPFPLAIFSAQYRIFGMNPMGYYAFNLVLHAFNAFLVYFLVLAFIPDKRIATLSSSLFVLGVGSYGKAVLFVGGMENLLLTMLYLGILNLYIRNDRYEDGRVLSPRYFLVLFLFLLASYAQPTAFSLIMGLFAYKLFFSGERGGRNILAPNLIILVAAAVSFWILRELTGVVSVSSGLAGRDPWDFTTSFVKNMVSYLIHMFFPIHVSHLVATSHPVVRAIYSVAPVIRVIIGIFLISYSAFGFVFGNRTIRFFLAWTFISVLPFCALQLPEDWLNIRYLYQVSVGFCFILASGTVLSMDLLYRRRWRRFVPYLAPLIFVVLSAFINTRLDAKYETAVGEPNAVESRAALESH
jgi:hypothetical protein